MVSSYRRNGAALVPVLLVFVVARGHRLFSSTAAFAPLELPASPYSTCPFLLLLLVEISAQLLHCGRGCALSLAAFHGDHRGLDRLCNDECVIRLPSSAPPTCRASAQRGSWQGILYLILSTTIVDRRTSRVLSVVLVAFDLSQDDWKQRANASESEDPSSTARTA